MKIAILNLGNNIQGFKTTPASETIYLSECLKDMGLDVDLISMKILNMASHLMMSQTRMYMTEFW